MARHFATGNFHKCVKQVLKVTTRPTAFENNDINEIIKKNKTINKMKTDVGFLELPSKKVMN